MQGLQVGLVGVSTGETASRVTLGSQLDDVAKVVHGRDVVEGTHEGHSVGVLSGVSS